MLATLYLMIPSLIHLRVTRTGAPGTEEESEESEEPEEPEESEEARLTRVQFMTEEMWAHVVSFFANSNLWDGDTVCMNITRLCEVRTGPWAQHNGCHDDGWVWKETSKRLGWYGQYDNWDDLLRSIIQNPQLYNNLETPSPKEYFKYCCFQRTEFMTALEDWNQPEEAIHGWLDDEDRHEIPYIRAMLIAVFDRRPELLKQLPTDDVDYNAFANAAVSSDGSALQWIPGSLDVYGEPPKIVPPIAGYTEYAKAAVRQAGNALQWVPGSTGEGGRVQLQPPIADYVEIAKLAVAENPGALDLVPGSWTADSTSLYHDQRSVNPLPNDDYVEIAKVALAHKFDEWPGMEAAVKRCIDPSLKARLGIQE